MFPRLSNKEDDNESGSALVAAVVMALVLVISIYQFTRSMSQSHSAQEILKSTKTVQPLITSIIHETRAQVSRALDEDCTNFDVNSLSDGEGILIPMTSGISDDLAPTRCSSPKITNSPATFYWCSKVDTDDSSPAAKLLPNYRAVVETKVAIVNLKSRNGIECNKFHKNTKTRIRGFKIRQSIHWQKKDILKQEDQKKYRKNLIYYANTLF